MNNVTMIKLRPHHIFCILNYEGKGYSKEFNDKMKELIKRLGEGENFELVFGADSLCAACPNLKNGVCETEEKVRRYDKTTAELLGLYEKQSLNQDIFNTAKERVLNPENFDSVCFDCEWAYICHKKGNYSEKILKN